LGGGATRDAYEYWAFTAHPSVDRVRVLDEHPRGQGHGGRGAVGHRRLGDAAVTAVDAYVQARRR
ncbi:hypothetical protein, partial [Deinococcus wulumuqiensis]|uniref:hypothetical protein n=1 Tax=Deinococcus wulumuqiensis TaxID=980427 RepID=UPI0035F03222